MQLKWKDGVYNGDVVDGMPHGRGVLTLENGIQKGIWEKGVLTKGASYVGDTLYIGTFDEQGRYHGKGYYEKENILSWQGEWQNGKIIKDDNSEVLPNCVFIGSYYGGIEPKNLGEMSFPKRGKVGRSGYYNMRVKADYYEMPLLSNAFGFKVVCAVEAPNNRWDYSKGYNKRAMLFCGENCRSMYTDAWVVKWENGDYAPLTAQEAFDINNFIHEVLAYENIEEFGKISKIFANRKFVLLEEGIYKGDLDENGKPTGSCWILYNHDDEQGRALYKGDVKDAIPDGYGELFYRNDAENRHYKGNFKNGLFHTQGTNSFSKATLIKNNGADWYGFWVEGEFEGDDNAIAIGGWAYEKYDGKFVKSQIVKGTHRNPKDKRGEYHYTGEFLNFLPHGFGTETIDGKQWTGHFANGKRLVGQGVDESQNALELFDPFTVKAINVEDYAKQSFAMQIVTTADKLQIVTDGKIKEYSKQMGVPLALVCAKDDGVAPNGIAKQLFEVDATGSCILCCIAGEECAPLPKINLEKLSALLQNQLDELRKQNANILCQTTLVDETHKSDWDVTRETHDDYPLEADHDFFDDYFYLVAVGDERYLCLYHTFTTYKWRASRQDDEDFHLANASIKAHKVPLELTDCQQLKDYCNAQNKWSALLVHDTISNETVFAEIRKNGGFLPILLERMFGAKAK